MDSDERFKHLAKDPRFRALRKPKDVKIDERFQSMFTDEKFIPKTKDKRGFDDDDDESEVSSSSSDESESDSETDEIPDHLNLENIEYDWQALDEDAERADESSSRIAIQHMDWDHLDVRDIYTLVNSIRPPKRVRIYVSEFGKERLKQEELEGPKELFDRPKLDEEEEEYKMLEEKMKAIENPKASASKANEYEDADEALDPRNLEIRERIRKYQLSRMKYYYAIVEFDSIESAEAVYKELDGMEYEGSSLELDLRFVPDDVEFDDEDIKAECDKVPDLTTYKAPLFINSALQQTTVKLTWDETDIRRQEKLNRAYTKEELDKDDLEEFLASGDDDDEDEAQKDSGKYQDLLRSLDEEEGLKKKVDVKVDWDEPDSDCDSNSDPDSDDKGSESDESSSSSSTAASEAASEAASVASRPGSASSRESASASLDLLLMNDNNKQEDFEFNPDDDRFKAVYTSRLYNIDPSHPNFKRTKAFDMIAERKRRKTAGSK